MKKEISRQVSKRNDPKGKKAQHPQRLKPAVGEPWPEATEVKNQRTGTNGIRGGVLVGLVFLTSALLLGFAAYALLNKDERMILEIMGFVKMFLSAVGGWAIGKSMR
jgi:hypothetical protein